VNDTHAGTGSGPTIRRWRVEENTLQRLLEETSNQRPGFIPRTVAVLPRGSHFTSDRGGLTM